MQIQINIDHNFEIHETSMAQFRSTVQSALSRFSEHITRVEIHLSDENADKSGQNDKRCLLEARLERRQPMAVTHTAANLSQALDGALDKMTRMIDSTLGRGQQSGKSHDEDQT
ncbi:MAG: ribosomal subunit interface protein [Betaproteobacteria bacterium HGW-Betaproteobacteria-7]|jgi:ribosome-associated translation inhibitor RaiA|nr:MAG: ribosomal subunit interface protein [Betaproteobacteria bacterium HGW-Betaproteobacteria-7]